MIHPLDRRDFLSWSAHGLTATAMLDLVSRQKHLLGAIVPSESTDPPPHLPAKCKRVIHLYMCGGLSHLDSFDYKPSLEKYHGKPMPSSEKPETFFGKIGLIRKNDWDFHQHGESGLWVSNLFPHLASVADELTLIRSMAADSANHTPATFQANTGFRLNGFPVMGSWMSYGLGCETDELPAYVVLPDPRGFPAGGTINWSNGFLPARYQGVAFRTKGQPIDDLFPASSAAGQGGDAARFDAESEQETREFIAALNRHHQATRPESDLVARIKSYELAAKMQLSVPRVTDLSGETAETQSSYGLDRPETSDFGRSCLLARRLLEQGVRFVQLFAGGSFGSPRINWDGHEDMKENHSQEALRVDQPIAALLRDLRRRGMLDETLVVFTTEFGRTPFAQSEANVIGGGRDHNMYGFTVWMAGGGLKHGTSYGATDEIGWKAVEKTTTWPDLHATILHLLGIDHERLKYYHNGIERRLTNVHGEVIRDILS
jgi:hypothetical protein